MLFNRIKSISIDSLGLSQIYISQEKYASVSEWFSLDNMESFQPVSVHDFGNGIYTLTDGHTRALIAYENGLTMLPAIYDNDDIVTNPTGQSLYKADMEWCARFGLNHIKQLGDRIIDKDLYKKLWIERCDRSYNLITKTTDSERLRLQKLVPNLFFYGASEEMSELYFENASGDLFIYKENSLILEMRDCKSRKIM